MTVTRKQLEAQLQKVHRECSDPRAGLYRPDSLMWRVSGEQAVFLAAGRAALLQEAHPFVAWAIERHSLTQDDPQGRFERTFRNVYAMVFGDLEHAVGCARKVFEIHGHIHGTLPEDCGNFKAGDSYRALDESSTFWVHATLIDSALLAYELVHGALEADEREAYYQQSKRFSYLFGLDDSHMPGTWPEFQTYFDAMVHSNTLHVGPLALRMLDFLMLPPSPGLENVMRWYRVITTALLPPRLRDDYKLPWGIKEKLLYRATMPAACAAIRNMPPELRYARPYLRARKRLGTPVKPSWGERATLQALRSLARAMAGGESGQHKDKRRRGQVDARA